MEKKRLIACLDLKDGQVVKGVKFENFRRQGEPLELALYYDQAGVDELFLLDITATEEGRSIFLELIKEISSRVSIPLAVGGGIRSVGMIEKLLEAGAGKVSIGSAAIEEPALIREGVAAFGSKSIVVAIDAKRKVGRTITGATAPGKETSGKEAHVNETSWEVYVQAGKKATGLDVVEWAREVEELGAGEILLTSMDKDGTRDGYDLDLLRAIKAAVNIPVIASGGAGKPEHFRDAFLIGKADAVLAASIFHEREFTIAEVKEYLQAEGIPVRH